MPKIKIREVLIEIAQELFLKKGYEAVQMSELRTIISQKLGKTCNVYYYFHSKEEIYLEVWKKVVLNYIKSHKDVFDNNLTAEEQLKKYIVFRLNTYEDNEAYRTWYQLMFMEFNHPTPFQKQILSHYFFPTREFVINFLHTILGEKAQKNADLLLCIELCVITPILRILEFSYYKTSFIDVKEFFIPYRSVSDIIQSDNFADLVFDFAKNGIIAVCQRFGFEPLFSQKMVDLLPNYNIACFFPSDLIKNI